ncbi:MAG: DUF1643 domain-containing protein [Eubacterium sp.]
MRDEQKQLPIARIRKVDLTFKIKADKCEKTEEKRQIIHAEINPDAHKTAIVIGINPSTANEDHSDRTFTKTGRYLAQYDVGDFYMLNLYEHIDPKLPDHFNDDDLTDWEKHRERFDKADVIIVAWGTESINLEAKKRAEDFLKIYRRKVLCICDQEGKHSRRYRYEDELTWYFENHEFPVITLCGSTRFKDEFFEVQKRLTLDGYIVISVGLFGHAGDQEVWESMDEGTITKTKEMLDDMHKRKIDMSDGIFVINVGGYIGSSTRSEIEYAMAAGKKVEYLESVK